MIILPPSPPAQIIVITLPNPEINHRGSGRDKVEGVAKNGKS